MLEETAHFFHQELVEALPPIQLANLDSPGEPVANDFDLANAVAAELTHLT
jgi:hypothetical protein